MGVTEATFNYGASVSFITETQRRRAKARFFCLLQFQCFYCLLKKSV